MGANVSGTGGSGGGTPVHLYSYTDLEGLLAHYGQSSGMTKVDGDLDGDGAVTVYDLGILLADYGP